MAFLKHWCALTALLLMVCAATAQNKPATPIKVGKTHEFALEKREETDLGIQLAKGSYYIRVDMQLGATRASNIIMQIDLHKSNGVVVQTSIINANEIDKNARVAKIFRVATAGSYRLRVKNQTDVMQYWLTVLPEKEKAPAAFGWGAVEYKPLAIGAENGKGGTLEPQEDTGWDAWHSTTLQPGKYKISLYLAYPDGETSSNLIANVEMYDTFGIRKPEWQLDMNEIGKESRVEKSLILTKPTKVIFRVRNALNLSINYIVGIEKV